MSSTSATLFDAVKAMNFARIDALLEQCGGACYLVQPDMLARNCQRLINNLREHYPLSSVAYSYKTNYTEALIKAATQSGLCSEVVSWDEYSYAQALGVADDSLIFNGVGKSEAVLVDALSRPITLVIDSIRELRACVEIASSNPVRARLGLRVSPSLSFMNTGSRFGIDFEDSAQMDAVQGMLRKSVLRIVGLHLHHSGDRSAHSFVERLDYLCALADRLSFIELKFIDCGGGLGSGMPEELAQQLPYEVASLEAYGQLIGSDMKNRFPAGDVELILEPGTGLLADVGVYLTPVLDTKTVGGRSHAIIDGTVFTIDPLRSRVPPLMCKLNSQPSTAGVQQVKNGVSIDGNSCMEIDVIHPNFTESVNTGDILMVAQKGAYALCMAAPFIQGIPALASLNSDGSFTILRERTSSTLIRALSGTFPEAASN